MTDEEQLLRAYGRERSETAFRELVAGHVDFVYSKTLRVVNGDSHLAQDVAQTVFIDLVRKAGSLPRDVALAGWLHRTPVIPPPERCKRSEATSGRTTIPVTFPWFCF